MGGGIGSRPGAAADRQLGSATTMGFVPLWGVFFREALRALCVRALAPTRKTISATFSVLRRTSSVVLFGGLRCGSSIPGSSVWFEPLSNKETAYLFSCLGEESYP